ncbi:MAG: class I SAM-dependent methyltransferase [Thermoplasmata archaeon]|nr:class I SAM-dependent methyltransferase [Thermoplasmata archaeon]
MRRRLIHMSAHPLLWARFLYRHDLRHEDVRLMDNPRFADWEPMYRVAREPLARLTGRTPEELDRFYRELAPIHRQLEAEAGRLQGASALMQAPLLYLIVRATHPALALETGVSSGFSSRLILEALEANGSGELHSIGVAQVAAGRSSDGLGDAVAARPIGYLVSERLRARWHLHFGRSDDVMPGLLTSLAQPLDLFLHDSRHQYDTMTWEYTTALPHLRPNGLLLSHDIHTCRAWPDFIAARSLAGDEELDHDLGGVRVPIAPARG